MHGFMSYQHFGKVRSLRNDRAWLELGHYVATEPCACSELGCYVATKLCACPELGRYVVTEPCACSVALRSDQAVCVLGRYVATELGLSSVST
ncbi:hypothetical protein F2Q69_00007560 [Brassica cretica]|uniref:Uncharacterized protein n=1 Tax=Brassica cretica TaxID=69181 RepID=A0A8S9PCH8_BRACR|nr:hypothetical protein F2Q69_00007560 [Brassica cretica]